MWVRSDSGRKGVQVTVVMLLGKCGSKKLMLHMCTSIAHARVKSSYRRLQKILEFYIVERL